MKQKHPIHIHFTRLLVVFIWFVFVASLGIKTTSFVKADQTSMYKSIAPSNFCPEASDYNRMKQILATPITGYNSLLDYYKAYAASPAGTDWTSTGGGYDIPAFTDTALEAAIGCGDTALISQIADIYLSAAGTLVDSPYDGITRKHWRNATQGEQYTSSQQWFYGLTRILATIATTPSGQRTSSMNTFVSTYKSVISGYYKCWIWKGCTEITTPNPALAQFVNTMYANVDQKDTLTYSLDDRYQWPMAAVPQLYLALKADPSTVDLTGNNYAITEAQIVQFIKDSSKLLQQRSVAHQVTNLQGQTVTAYNFDPNFGRNLDVMQYSAYDGYCFPITGQGDQAKASALASALSGGSVTNCPTVGYIVPIPYDTDMSIDFGHAWRLIHLYTSLYTVQPLVNSVFPTYNDVKYFTNQLAYVISNRDLNYPKFKNFMNGANGWYRVNYNGNIGYGLSPWSLGNSYITQGWGLLSGFNPDLVTITRRIRDIMNSTATTDKNFTHDVYGLTWVATGYVVNGYRDYSNPNSKYWFYFLGAIPPAGFTYNPNSAPVADTTAPSGTITSPASNSTVSGSSVGITISASDNVGVTKVEYSLNGSLFSTSTVSPYSSSLNTTGYASGTYDLTAKVYDAAGNTTTTPVVKLTILNVTATIPALCTNGTRVELENTTVNGGAIVADTSASNNSEWGSALAGAYVQFAYNAPGGDVTMVSRYSSSNGAGRTLSIDGSTQKLTFAKATSYTLLNTPLTLSSGTKNIKISIETGDSGGMAYDYVDFCPVAIPTPTPTPIITSLPSDPVNPTKPVTVIIVPEGPVDSTTPSVPVSGSIMLQPSSPVTSNKKIKKVEYSVNGKKLPSNNESPYQLDSSLLPNGEHIITQTVLYEDGTTSTQQAKVDVKNAETPIVTPVVRYIRLNKMPVIMLSALTSATSSSFAAFYYLKKKHLLPEVLQQYLHI